jgi:hypothetical protein
MPSDPSQSAIVGTTFPLAIAAANQNGTAKAAQNNNRERLYLRSSTFDGRTQTDGSYWHSPGGTFSLSKEVG